MPVLQEDIEPPIDNGGEAVERLKAFAANADPWTYDAAEAKALQLTALQDLFEIRRRQIRVLDRRASDLAINRLNGFADLVPLLFAHQTYKSYPENFVSQNKWKMMNRWLETLSTIPLPDIDVDDVRSTDEWLHRLARAGRPVLVSGGTSGKSSFLHRTAKDRQLMLDTVVRYMSLAQDIPEGSRDRPVFVLSPKYGNYTFVSISHAVAESFGRPDAIYWLSERPIDEVELRHQAELKLKITNGTALPEEIRELESSARATQDETGQRIGQLVDALVRHRNEPVVIYGMSAPVYLIMEEARRRGIGDGELVHPESCIHVGGGAKATNLPPDYMDQIHRFFHLGPEQRAHVYGMVELSAAFFGCVEGGYHAPPWIAPLVLNEEGDRLLNPSEGTVEGRMAAFDFAIEGRWGGIITSDKVVVDFSPCACGRSGPSVKSITRYADLKNGDDKLGCGGTMAAYVRTIATD